MSRWTTWTYFSEIQITRVDFGHAMTKKEWRKKSWNRLHFCKQQTVLCTIAPLTVSNTSKFQGSPHAEILKWFLHTCHQASMLNFYKLDMAGKCLIFSNRNADTIRSSTPFLHVPPCCTLFLRNGVIGVLAETTESLIAPQSQTGTRFPICKILPGTYTEPTFIPRSTWYEHIINYRWSLKTPQRRR